MLYHLSGVDATDILCLGSKIDGSPHETDGTFHEIRVPSSCEGLFRGHGLYQPREWPLAENDFGIRTSGAVELSTGMHCRIYGRHIDQNPHSSLPGGCGPGSNSHC